MSELSDSQKSKTFLIADDYSSMRTILATDLNKLGVTKIFTASSGNEAINIIKSKMGTSEAIEVLITDMMMPNGSGLDLTIAVRKLPELKKLPILMISSMDEVGKMLECVRAGVNDYIVKPWALEDLSKKLSRLT